jgi:transcriptional regulator with XRE-family HTH domain
MESLDRLSQFTLNLRWLMSQRASAPSEWGGALEKLSRSVLGYSRALGLLWGADPKTSEVEMLGELVGFDTEELRSVPLYGRDQSVRRMNFQYLLDALPKGAAQEAAQSIGITPSQLSRWRQGVENPRATNVRKLLRFHGMDPDIDLDKVPLFLSMEPVSGYQQKKWVADRLMEMPADQMAAIYPALKKMLRTDEDH